MTGVQYSPDDCIFIISQPLNANQFDVNSPANNLIPYNILWDTVANSLIWVNSKTGIIVYELIGGTGMLPFGNDIGVVNAVQVTIPGATLTDGYLFEVKVLNTNTGASTLQINSLGVKPLVNGVGGPLAPGAMQSGIIYLFTYNISLNSYQFLGQAQPQSVFVNSLPMPTTVGGYVAGTTFPTPQTMQQMWNGLLYQTLQPNLQAWYNSLIIKPSASLLAALNTLMKGLETDGDLLKLDLFHPIGGLETDEQRLRPIISSSGLDFIPINSPVLNNFGITSGAGYLNTRWNPTLNGVQFSNLSATIGTYNRTDGNASTGTYGAYDNATNLLSSLYIARFSNQVLASLNSVYSVSFSAFARFIGTHVVKRVGGNMSFIAEGLPGPSTAVPANGLINKDFYLGAVNGFGDNGDGKTQAMVMAGSGLVSDVNFNNRIQTYMTARGIAV